MNLQGGRNPFSKPNFYHEWMGKVSKMGGIEGNYQVGHILLSSITGYYVFTALLSANTIFTSILLNPFIYVGYILALTIVRTFIQYAEFDNTIFVKEFLVNLFLPVLTFKYVFEKGTACIREDWSADSIQKNPIAHAYFVNHFEKEIDFDFF